MNNDWGYFKKEVVNGKETVTFLGYTLRHRLRLFMGMNGMHHNGQYTYSVPNWGSVSFQKKMYWFMNKIGNPLLNKIL